MKRILIASFVFLIAGSMSAQEVGLFRGYGVESPAGPWRFDAVISNYRPDTFVDRNHDAIRFPGDLSFDRAEMRLSRRLFENLSVGVTVPYRRSYLESSELTASYVASGVPGVGVFFDWNPRRTFRRFSPSFRLDYFRPGTGGDQPITINDDIRTVTGSLDLRSTRPMTAADLRVAAMGRLQYGFRHETAPRYVAVDLLAASGPRIATWRGSSLFLSAVAGVHGGTAARQEGNFFANRNAHGAIGGVMLSAAPRGSLRDSLTLSLTRDFAVKNGLRGWRATIGFHRSF
ncbi:MAG: hypothetical protein WBX15_18565 [Thermoanaerobaculia bacterium]